MTIWAFSAYEERCRTESCHFERSEKSLSLAHQWLNAHVDLGRNHRLTSHSGRERTPVAVLKWPSPARLPGRGVHVAVTAATAYGLSRESTDYGQVCDYNRPDGGGNFQEFASPCYKTS